MRNVLKFIEVLRINISFKNVSIKSKSYFATRITKRFRTSIKQKISEIYKPLSKNKTMEVIKIYCGNWNVELNWKINLITV